MAFYVVDIVNFHLEARVIVNKADKGRYFRFKDDGSFLAEGECQAGNGQERLATNGDLYGSPWGDWLKDCGNNNFLLRTKNQDTIGTFALAWSNMGNVDMNTVVSGSNLYPSTADVTYLDWPLPGAWRCCGVMRITNDTHRVSFMVKGELIIANLVQGTVIKNPRSKDPTVSVDADISIKGVAFIPFTTMPTDTAGKEIYIRALAGEYGDISLISSHDYYWSNGKWTASTQEELTHIAGGHKATPMQKANAVIAPLNNAVELDIATKEEKTFQRMAKYRFMLNCVDTSKTTDMT